MNLHNQAVLASEHDGIFIEAGCALGGSSIVIAAARSPSKKLYIYDVFGMIPPPSNADGADVHERYSVIKSGNSPGIAGNKYYGYIENLIDEVKSNFKSCKVSLSNVEFVKGLYQDTMKIDEPVAFAHIDCDWYESVMVCLNQIIPNLVIGGRVVVDDYFAWSGCKAAVDEFFSDKQSFQILFDDKIEKLTIVRTGE